MINSSSGSCHDSDATWQEIGRTCGSACIAALVPLPRPNLRTEIWHRHGKPSFPMIAYLFMEYLEQKLLDTAPMELKPRLWKRYVDDIFEVVKKTSVEGLTKFLNNLDDFGSIKFTYEMESEGKLPFLDLLITEKTPEQ